MRERPTRVPAPVDGGFISDGLAVATGIKSIRFRDCPLQFPKSWTRQEGGGESAYAAFGQLAAS